MKDLSRRELCAGLAALPAIGTPLARGRGAERSPSSDLSFVNLELRPAARQLAKMVMPELSDRTLPLARKQGASFSPPPLAAPAYARRTIKGAGDAPDVGVYVINARPGAGRPAILHTHGGGYIMGDAHGNLFDLQTTAAALDCVIVSVDYRLAPETNFRDRSRTTTPPCGGCMITPPNWAPIPGALR